MVKLQAMLDGEDVGYTCLGTLCPLESEPSTPVSLKKKITVYNLGSYTKRLQTPMYRKKIMAALAVSTPTRCFDPSSCLGVLCGSLRNNPEGYVERISGGHRFCLPVYNQQQVSGSFYRIAGYLVTQDGFLAVAKRRWLLWMLLGLLGGCTFVLTYLLLQYGAEGAWVELNRFVRTLLPMGWLP